MNRVVLQVASRFTLQGGLLVYTDDGEFLIQWIRDIGNVKTFADADDLSMACERWV